MVLQDSLGQTTYVRFKNVKVMPQFRLQLSILRLRKIPILLINKPDYLESHLYDGFLLYLKPRYIFNPVLNLRFV